MTMKPTGYADDTEFLTTSGWRTFDEIAKSAPVGTLAANGEFEFQIPSVAVEANYRGDVHVWRARHSEAAVTPDVEMWVAAVRNRNRVCGPRGRHAFELASSSDLLSGHRSYFELRLAAEPRRVDHAIEDLLIIAVGCYVTEGCVAKRLRDGSPSVLRFSQKVGGNLEPYLEHLQTVWPDSVRVYSYARTEDWRMRPCVERVFTMSRRALARRIVEECGERKEKHLPAWAFLLSGRQARLLLDVLMSGDGTVKADYRVYYSNSARLSGDVQALAVSTGLPSEVWGPYENGMYQVYVGDRNRNGTVVARMGRSVSVHPLEGRVVGFVVPNQILVTRRDRRVGLQGSLANRLVR
jgi:hypothetical protein